MIRVTCICTYLSDSSMPEEEDIFHEIQLVRERCKKNVTVSHLNIIIYINSFRQKCHDSSDLFSEKLIDILFVTEAKVFNF